MPLTASIGHAQALDGREAGLQAAHHALNHLGVSVPSLCIVIASHQYGPREVLSGVSSLMTDVPLIGFSSPAALTPDGQHQEMIVPQMEQFFFGEGAALPPNTGARVNLSAAR